MFVSVSDDLSALMEQVLLKYFPTLLDRHRSPSYERLEAHERDAIEKCIVAELCDTGLDDNDEPNQRGLKLEALIDALMRSR